MFADRSPDDRAASLVDVFEILAVLPGDPALGAGHGLSDRIAARCDRMPERQRPRFRFGLWRS